MSTPFGEDECPLCRSEIYLNPSLKLVKAICGHKFCEPCIARHITFSNLAIQCPICKTTLKKDNFMKEVETMDPEVEADLKVRPAILKIYNKRREDFPDLKSYNDYLEEVEDIIYNLANRINVEETQKKINKYKEENKELIVLNQSKKADELRQMREMLLIEEQEKEDRKKQAQKEEQELLESKLKEREALLDALATGSTIEKKGQTTADLKRPSGRKPTVITSTQVSTKVTTKVSFTYAPGKPPTIAPVQAVQTQPKPPPAEFVMPQPIKLIQEKTETVLTEEQKFKQMKAAGWKVEYPFQRALQEAFSCLFV